MINPLHPGLGPATFASSPHKLQLSEILLPNILNISSLVLNPITFLIPDSFSQPLPLPGVAHLAQSAEDRAIAEKGFYLHLSPRAVGLDEAPPPRLLSIFPMTSLRVVAAISSSPTSP